jgi:lipoprotein-releasing system ATP-binding protein
MEDKMSSSGTLISCRGVCKGFDTNDTRIEILESVDIDITTGETVAIQGASGIGKSTLLHILGTLDHPDKGTVLFKEEDIFNYDSNRLAAFRNKTVGFVFQFHHLLPEFSTLENVMMPALIQGSSRQAARKSAEEILIRVGLKKRLDFLVNRLSGGEHQRVALARALVLKPLLLLADEPTGNLDKKNSKQVHQLLLELNRELNMTMVVVTHNPELAGYMSRDLTIIDGKLVDL